MLNHDANHVFLFENTSVGNKLLIDFLVVFLLIASVHTQANEDDFAINQDVMIRIYVINRPFSTLESLAISGVKIEHIVVNAHAVCQRSPVFIQVRTTQYECLLLGKETYSLMNEFQKSRLHVRGVHAFQAVQQALLLGFLRVSLTSHPQ